MLPDEGDAQRDVSDGHDARESEEKR